MSGISRMNMGAPTNSSLLNAWTPTPLKLAGLLTSGGNVRSRGPMLTMDEIPEDDVCVGVSALDFDGIEAEEHPAPINRSAIYTSDDDAGSSLSHMSLMDARFDDVMRQLNAEKQTPLVMGDTHSTHSSDALSTCTDDSHPQAHDGQVVVHRKNTDAPFGKHRRSRRSTRKARATDLPGDSTTHATTEPSTYTNAPDETLTLIPNQSDPVDVSVPPNDLSLSEGVFETGTEWTIGSPIQTLAHEELEQSELCTSPSIAVEIAYSIAEQTIQSFSDDPTHRHNEHDSGIQDDDADKLGNSRETTAGTEEELDKTEELDEPSASGVQGPSYLEASPASDRCFSPGNSLRGRAWSTDKVFGADASFSTELKSALRQQHTPTRDASCDELRSTVDTTEPNTDTFNNTLNNQHVEYAIEPSGSQQEDFVLVHPSDVQTAAGEWQEANAWRVRQLLVLCRERGLHSHNARCQSCDRPIGFAFSPYRVCAFDGMYYCHDCHQNEVMPIPAQIIHNWCLTPMPVCRASRAFLEHISDRPLIRLDQCNPTIYEYVPAMMLVMKLREQLSLVGMYLLTCKESVAEDLRKRLWPKEYLFEEIHQYSLNDLVSVSTGVLARHLRSVLVHATAHVAECRVCAQKGFICELCTHPQVIYPFQMDTTHRCPKCYSVYHNACMDGRLCPKCQRKQVYEKERSSAQSTSLNMPFAEALDFR